MAGGDETKVDMSDADIVQHVLRHKTDYYKILRIERTASAQEIKVAYKKLALRCHPDKNPHPQAAEAFKIVGAAHATLADPTKRSVYERAGAAGVQRHESGAGRNGNAQNNPYRRHPQNQADFFEEFFGFSNSAFFQGQRRAGTGTQQAQGQFRQVEIDPNLLMLIPVIIFVFLALLFQSSMTDFHPRPSTSQGSEEVRGVARFSLTPSAEKGFIYKRVAKKYGMNIPFYVSQKWSDAMERRRDLLTATEMEVAKQYHAYLGDKCQADTFRFRTRNRKDTPESCTDYHRLRRAMG